MPRHEIIVERIPDAYQGESARLPPPTTMPHVATRTVAEYRASNPDMRHKCVSCGVSFDMSSLDPVFDDWGPDAVITVSLSHHCVPGEAPARMRARIEHGAQEGGFTPPQHECDP